MALLTGQASNVTAHLIGQAIRLSHSTSAGVKATTISANATFDVQTSTVSVVNGGAADRDITAVAAVEKVGFIKFFKNSGTTNNLVIKDSAGTVLATLTPGQYCLLAYGAAWHVFAPGAVATLAPTAITLTDNQAAALDVKEASNVYLRFVTTNSGEKVVTGKPLSLAGGIATDSRFTSTEQTGTGSSQDIAHGLAATPSVVGWMVSDSGATGIYTAVPGSHDATNIKMTVTAGVKYYVWAIK
jgi:hypothetical protein